MSEHDEHRSNSSNRVSWLMVATLALMVLAMIFLSGDALTSAMTVILILSLIGIAFSGSSRSKR